MRLTCRRRGRSRGLFAWEPWLRFEGVEVGRDGGDEIEAVDRRNVEEIVEMGGREVVFK